MMMNKPGAQRATSRVSKHNVINKSGEKGRGKGENRGGVRQSNRCTKGMTGEEIAASRAKKAKEAAAKQATKEKTAQEKAARQADMDNRKAIRFRAQEAKNWIN